jgi:hypothetical protein
MLILTLQDTIPGLLPFGTIIVNSFVWIIFMTVKVKVQQLC